MASSVYVCEGKKSVGDAVIDVVGSGIKHSVTSAGSAAAGRLAAGVTSSALTAIGITSPLAPVVAGIAVVGCVGSFISSLFD